MTPHKHADLIKAWADGAEIEFKIYDSQKWEYISRPSWIDNFQYRIKPKQTKPKFKIGDFVWKRAGSEWAGHVVGTYSTKLTPEGYAVESKVHKGSVQIYPAAALKGNNDD